jgi:outer membrane protein assembly factor BamA
VGLLGTVRTNPALPLKEQDIPLPERFFAGGASTHRGFPENQAGPRDLLTGFPLGGKAMVLLSTELRFPLIGENLGAAVFHDAGNIYSRAGTVSLRLRQKNRDDFNYMVHAVGFGIRYRTPVGPVRFDLAFAPNSPRFFGCQGTREQLLFGCPARTEQRISRFQFHFSLGQTF